MGISRENMQNCSSLSPDKDKKREQVDNILLTLPFNAWDPSVVLALFRLLHEPLGNGWLVEATIQTLRSTSYSFCNSPRFA